MDFDKYFEQGKLEILEILVKSTEEKAKLFSKKIIKDSFSRKSMQASRLYNRTPFLRYGFNDAVKSGNYSPFLHESEDQVTCFPAAAAMFFIAEQLGFRPEFYNVYGLFSPEAKDHGVFDHALITVDIGNKKRTLIDPLLRMYGPVAIDIEKKKIQVDANKKTRYRQKIFTGIEKHTKSSLCHMLMEHRTPEGAMRILNGGEVIKDNFRFSGRNSYMWVTYDIENQCLETTVHEIISQLKDKAVKQQLFFDSDGNICDKRMQVFSYTENNWTKYEGVSMLLDFSSEILNPLFSAFESIFVKKDKNKSRVRQHNQCFKLLQYMAERGIENFDIVDSDFSYDLDVDAIKSAFSLVESEVRKDYRALRVSSEWHIQEKILLRRELYRLRLDLAKSAGIDSDGYLYSEKDRRAVIKENADKCINSRVDSMGEWVKLLYKKCHLGYKHYNESDYQRCNFVEDEMINNISDLMQMYIHERGRYNFIMDNVCFAKEHAAMSLEELHEEVASLGGDAYNQYKGQVWQAAVLAYQANGCLNNKEYVPALISKVQSYFYVETLKKKIGEIEEDYPDVAHDGARALSIGIYLPIAGNYLNDIMDVVLHPQDYSL
jgi:hypothetical protein